MENCTHRFEGKFLGVGSPRKYRVSWTSFEPPFVEEYGAQHSIFRKGRNEHQSSGVEQVNAASASSTSSSHAVIESDDTSNSSDSSEGEDFDHEENQRTCTAGKHLWVTDVSLDGRDPRPMEDIASLPPSMPGFATSRNQEVE